MADPRFFCKIEGGLSLAQLAQIGGVTLPDDVDNARVFHDVAGLAEATEADVSWAFIPAVREALKTTKAGAVVVPQSFVDLVPDGCVALVAKDAQFSYGAIACAFYPRVVTGGISDRSVVDPSAKIGEGTRIAAGAVVGAMAEIGANCDIQPNAVIGEGVVLGDGCTVGANATVSHCIAGNKVYFYPGCQVGQDGFGFAMSPEKGPQKLPQLGRVMIGDDVEIGACTTVDRGAMGDTVIGSGSRIDNLVQVAHNVKLGKCCIIVSQVGIAGSCEFGDFVVVGGQVGFAGHLKIGTGAKIGAQSGIMNNIDPGSSVMGSPAVPSRDFMRQVLAIRALTTDKKGKPKFSFKLWLAERLGLIKKEVKK